MKIVPLQQQLEPLLKELRDAIELLEQQYSDNQLGAGFKPWFHPQLFNCEAERPSDYLQELEQQFAKLMAWQQRGTLDLQSLTELETRIDDQLRALYTAVQKHTA